MNPWEGRIRRAIEEHAPLLRELSRRLHDHPELRFEEHRAAAWLSETLAGHGFEVERGSGGLDTSFRAELRGCAPGPTVALLCEYDALEELGHACGHNLIATMGLGAGLALGPLMERLPGRLLVLGTPGEEGGGGKIVLLEQGVFDGIDAALMIHPSDRDLPGAPMIARVAWRVRYRGVPAHAAAAPHLGVNALDAVRLAMNGMDALRQQVRPDVRMHAIISDGGDAPNIIPHRAALDVYLRAAQRRHLHDELLPRMRGVFEGAARMTGAEVEIDEIARAYDDIRINHTLAEHFGEVAARFGRSVGPLPQGGAGSTDLGNVSHALPCLHAFLAIDDSARPHTPEFAVAARSERGERTLLDGAAILATMAAELLADDAVMERARAEHASHG